VKVVGSIVNDSEISSVIDIVSDIAAPDPVKDKIKEAVGDYLIEQTLLAVGEAKSPISGEGWKKTLSPSYKKEKAEAGGSLIANMELHGDMLSSLDYELTDEGVKIGVFGSEAPKADGHNNFSGESELPNRRFLPDEGQAYKDKIQRGVQEIINDILAEEVSIDRGSLENVESSSQLYDVLGSIFTGASRVQIKRAVLGNPDLFDLLTELDLLDLL
jgi:hypothetical protein